MIRVQQLAELIKSHLKNTTGISIVKHGACQHLPDGQSNPGYSQSAVGKFGASTV